jgi:hypothetical protein
MTRMTEENTSAPREDDRDELIGDESPAPDPEEVDPARDDDDPQAD